ncbi:DUF397 domain-containing protein [Streptomyces sp. NPDC052396]|uniref:DUF397 domain-containing protein n=1 Tax=Streptomyces sp. NPDC052396 TaxID=3365689 RepID=UPI0037D2EC0B
MSHSLDLSIAQWRKSLRSTQGNQCLEIAEQYPGVMPVRDSKDPNRAPIVVPRAAWSSFVTAVAGTNGRLSA